MNATRSNQVIILTHPTFELDDETSYSIETVARMTRLHRHQIGVYCRHGLISTIEQPERSGWRFDLEAVRSLRQLERMRARFEMNIDGLRVMQELMSENLQLRADAQEQRQKKP